MCVYTKQFYPIYVSKQNNEKALNLLLISGDKKQHYVLIKDFKTKHRERKHVCMRCLQCFSTEEMLTRHNSNCKVINGEQAIRMPKEASISSSILCWKLSPSVDR